MSRETPAKTLLVATVLSVVCSIALAAAVTLLKPVQQVNKELDKQRKILAAAGLLPGGKGSSDEVRQKFAGLEHYVVDLDSGDFRRLGEGEHFDMRKATRDPQRSMALSTAQDIAKLKRRANEADIYLLREPDGRVKELILPVSGYGLWSTMHGYLVLKGDGNTVVGITFTEHAETPGLGGEIDNPRWQAQWPGKQVYGHDFSRPLFELKTGGVDAEKPEAVHQVDALSGATLTGHGVTHMMQFWLGELGYSRFLEKVRKGEV